MTYHRILLACFAVMFSWFSIARPVAAETFQPTWASIKPTRVVSFASDSTASDVQNGDRLVKAIAALVPGDALRIGSGTYSVQNLWDVSISGTPTAPIWIVAETNADVVITRPDARQNVMNVGQRNVVQHLCFRGIEITGGSHGVRLGQCNDVWIDRCYIHHTGEVCLSANTADTQRLFITRNKIHDGGGTAEGMYLGANQGKVIMSESVIAQNHVFNCRGTQGDGIEVKQGSWGNRIVANLVHDCNYPCITVYGTDGQSPNVIERNVCYRSGDSAMQVQGEAMVRNNLLIGGKNAAFASTDHQGKTRDLQVIHNTMINIGHAFRGGSWNDRDGMVLANNVIYSRDQNAMLFSQGRKRVTIVGNLLLGDGDKADNPRGRSIEDLDGLGWEGWSGPPQVAQAKPAEASLFQKGDASFATEVDLLGNARRPDAVLSGALIP